MPAKGMYIFTIPCHVFDIPQYQINDMRINYMFQPGFELGSAQNLPSALSI